jgi:hypothetical protein
MSPTKDLSSVFTRLLPNRSVNCSRFPVRHSGWEPPPTVAPWP